MVLDFLGHNPPTLPPHTNTTTPTHEISCQGIESLIRTPPPLCSLSHHHSPSLRTNLLGSPPPPSLPLLNISLNSSRVFLAADGRQFEWRRCDDDPLSYDASPFPSLSPALPLIDPVSIALYRPRQPKNRNLPTVPSGHADRTLLRIHVLSIRQRTSPPRISHRPLSKQMVGPTRAHNPRPIECQTRRPEFGTHRGLRNPHKNEITDDLNDKHTTTSFARHFPPFMVFPTSSPLSSISVVPYVPLSPLCDHGYPKCFVYYIRYSLYHYASEPPQSEETRITRLIKISPCYTMQRRKMPSGKDMGKNREKREKECASLGSVQSKVDVQ